MTSNRTFQKRTTNTVFNMKTRYLLVLLLSLTAQAMISPAIFFEAPGPIVHFEATAIVPPVSSDSASNNHAHGLWTGLSTANASVSLRNVIASTGTQWRLAPEYCCKCVNPRISFITVWNFGESGCGEWCANVVYYRPETMLKDVRIGLLNELYFMLLVHKDMKLIMSK